ncbi:MAG: acyl-CoA/acyl-ACP dehydrogenase [Chloroflexi bacterium]|nr:acyl-CoA/acyl-ACP dehydrogenase [Chloroflexota bacterium]
MDFGLSPEQDILKTTARDFFAEQAPTTLLREMRNQRPPYPADLWKKMADLGWMAIAIPEKYGGVGGSIHDLMVLVEEMGRAAFPGPLFTSLIGGIAIDILGSEKQKAELLPPIAAGKAVASLAILEPSLSMGADGIALTASHSAGGYSLSGTKLFVSDVEAADYLVVAARTGEGSGEDGISAILVNVKSAGSRLSVTRLDTVPVEDYYEVVFDGVVVGESAVLGQAGQAWNGLNRVAQIAAVAKCVDMVGAGQRMVETAVAHAKERVQFGRPIGSFQAIQHHCANAATAVDSARLIANKAVWMLNEGMECTKIVSMAKSFGADSHRRVTQLTHQVTGGVGLIIEHDLPMFTYRALASELLFGTPAEHRELVAQELGL